MYGTLVNMSDKGTATTRIAPHDVAAGTVEPREDGTPRERLVWAAQMAFAEKGFHATSTRDIASRAGMSPAAVYVHHSSKEELLFLLSDRGHRESLEIVRAGAHMDGDPAARLHAMMREFALWHAKHHTLARIVQYELGALTPEHHEEVAAYRREIQRFVREVIDAGKEAGVFATSDTQMTALAMLSLCIDVARWFRDDGQWSAERIADHYAHLALRMVIAA